MTPLLKGLDAGNPKIVFICVSGMVVFDTIAFKGNKTDNYVLNEKYE